MNYLVDDFTRAIRDAFPRIREMESMPDGWSDNQWLVVHDRLSGNVAVIHMLPRGPKLKLLASCTNAESAMAARRLLSE